MHVRHTYEQPRCAVWNVFKQNLATSVEEETEDWRFVGISGECITRILEATSAVS